MRRALIIATALILTGLFVYVIVAAMKRGPDAVHEVPFGMAGKQAPPFKMKRLDTGEEVKLDDLLGKQPIVLNFWATWCGPCKLEQPSLDYGYRKYGNQVAFVGVVFEDTEENTKRYIAENGVPYPQLYDPKSTVAVDYAVSGVPETYFINRNGKILGKVAEPIGPQQLDAKVKELIQ